MAQATQILSPSTDLLPVNELPPPPTLEQELAKALEDNPEPKPGRQDTPENWERLSHEEDRRRLRKARKPADETTTDQSRPARPANLVGFGPATLVCHRRPVPHRGAGGNQPTTKGRRPVRARFSGISLRARTTN